MMNQESGATLISVDSDKILASSLREKLTMIDTLMTPPKTPVASPSSPSTTKADEVVEIIEDIVEIETIQEQQEIEDLVAKTLDFDCLGLEEMMERELSEEQVKIALEDNEEEHHCPVIECAICLEEGAKSQPF
eukprot:Awhi_evm1s13690